MLESREYRAKTDYVYPVSARRSFEKLDSCFLGVSLENSNFTPEKLKAMAKWVSLRFSHCLVLVGDSIHRITLETTKSFDPNIALVEALKIGNSFIKEQEYIFRAFEDKTKFTIETCSQIQESKDYLYFYLYLKEFFNTNPKFRSSVEAFSRNYYNRRWNNVNNDLLEDYIQRSCEYFLEEFAIFSCLQRRGFSVMVYPGLFSTLTEIVNGEYPELFEEINELILVSIHFKKR